MQKYIVILFGDKLRLAYIINYCLGLNLKELFLTHNIRKLKTENKEK